MRRASILILSIVGVLLFALVPSAFAGKTVAVFLSGEASYYDEILAGFNGAMNRDGYASRQGLEIVVQRPHSDMMAWKNTARKLVALNVDAIVAVGGNAAHISMEETKSIPIVYTATYGATEMGLTASNVTGISADVSILNLMKVVRKAIPLSSVGVLYSRQEVSTVLEAKAIKVLESSMKLDAKYYNLDTAGMIGKIEAVNALVLTSCCMDDRCSDELFSHTRKQGVPVVALAGGVAEKGAVFSYVPDAVEQGEKAAEMVKSILSGMKPSEVSPLKPRKVNLVINLREAGALNIKVPFDVLTSASRVIQAVESGSARR